MAIISIAYDAIVLITELIAEVWEHNATMKSDTNNQTRFKRFSEPLYFEAQLKMSVPEMCVIL